MADTDEKAPEKVKQAVKENEPVKAADPVPSPAPAPSTQVFPVSDLIARSPEYLGVPQYIAAGGLYDQTGSITIAAAKQAIETWLQQPVETGKA